jgi:hypothetical protein
MAEPSSDQSRQPQPLLKTIAIIGLTIAGLVLTPASLANATEVPNSCETISDSSTSATDDTINTVDVCLSGGHGLSVMYVPKGLIQQYTAGTYIFLCVSIFILRYILVKMRATEMP